MPELKEVQIENSFTLCMDAPDAIERFIQTDNKLDEIKMHVKSLKNSADMNLEKTKFDLEKVMIFFLSIDFSIRCALIQY